MFFQEMLMDKFFYERAASTNPKISDFKLIEPEGLGR